ncbi:metal ABC transporter solute-binding protein, Zn/Mn family [Nonomuraea sediminis]|uniref:metal ABC transporter solute-binding protein, Zn/Mn family n=1 Tax=Nonomuraea sediminis TaxID=2835864 RepID=UPI002029FE25|nr:ATP-binding cassette domain-containing protein [Nonomuraea sediminis]
MPTISAAGLRLSAVSCRHGRLAAVDRVDLDLAPGDHLAITGTNGSGKSTLLRAVLGLHRDTSGLIEVDGEQARSGADWARRRAQVAWIPQRQARGGAQEPAKPGGLKVVAASNWEAAFAKAAGATDITVIVPPGVKHAPDYDPKPSDLAKVAEADVVLYAGFEGFAGKLKDAAGSTAKLIEVSLDNAPGKVKAEVRRLGGAFGTADAAEKWTESFDTEYAALKQKVTTATKGTTPVIVCQAFVAWAADLAGARPAGVYGPQPPTAGQIADLAARKPQLILDNSAMPGGDALTNLQAKRVVIDNFPDQGLDLIAMYRANADAIVAALG